MRAHCLFSLVLTACLAADLVVRDASKVGLLKPRLVSKAAQNRPHNATLRVLARGLQPEGFAIPLLGKRQYCDAGYGYCSTNGYCCPAADGCCATSCTPSGGACCDNGESCYEGEACCDGGCMPAGNNCCDNGVNCDFGYRCCGGDNYSCAPEGAECCSDYGRLLPRGAVVDHCASPILTRSVQATATMVTYAPPTKACPLAAPTACAPPATMVSS